MRKKLVQKRLRKSSEGEDEESQKLKMSLLFRLETENINMDEAFCGWN